jgi:heme exporter protein C
MALAFKAFFIWVMLMRIRGEINEGKIRAVRLRQVHGHPQHEPLPLKMLQKR